MICTNERLNIILFLELPDLLPLKDVTEALLKVKYGPWLLCRLVGNTPDCFEQGKINMTAFAIRGH